MIDYLNPEGWARPKGYSNVVSGRGRQVFVAGQIGWNEREQFETDDFAGQVRQALSNIKACLAAAGAEPHHLVRLTWYVTDKQEYLSQLSEVGAAYRETLGRVWRTARSKVGATTPCCSSRAFANRSASANGSSRVGGFRRT